MLDLNTTKQVNEKGFKPKLVNPTTHTITIGRNVGNKPLPNHKWQGFQSAIISFIERHNSIIYVHSLGVGIWEGIEEQNCTFVFSSKEFLNLKDLKRLAKLFRQDAIALTSGSTQFIG
jgi:predicted ATP-grasp superfamily ATP-dependent carboligase